MIKNLEQLGYCPRCNTDGPCRAETGSLGGGWFGDSMFDFQEGDICDDRPLKNEDIARALLADKYYSNGSELRSFWKDGKICWLSKRCGVTDAFPHSYHPSLDCICTPTEDIYHPIRNNMCPDHGPGKRLHIWGRGK